ncbi:MAG: GAF domain-containing protein [Verrucomicrobia bacterium]|nr:GAF domain-containing protein [Verrucomicrobiota bacterium]
MSAPRKNTQPQWLRRLGHFWSGIQGSLTIKIFSWVSVIALADFVMKLHKQALDLKLISEGVVTALQLAYVIVGAFAVRAFFIIGENAGAQAEKVQHLEQVVTSHYDVYASLHCVIHQTRDSLLSDGAFLRLADQSDVATATKHVFDTISAQLGMLERAMRAISGADCQIVFKVLKPDPNTGEPGLVTCAYSPSTPLERRKNSTTLPTNQGIAQEALITKKIAWTNDILTDSRFWPQEQKQSYGARYRTVVTCPVITNKTVVGVLCFDWKEPNMYDKNFGEILACFTDVVSVACYIGGESRKVKPKATEGVTNK